MPNPFEDQSVSLEKRLACSNAALEHAAAMVTYQVAKNRLLAARRESGAWQPELHQAAIDAQRALSVAEERMNSSAVRLAAAIGGA